MGAINTGRLCEKSPVIDAPYVIRFRSCGIVLRVILTIFIYVDNYGYTKDHSSELPIKMKKKAELSDHKEI